MVVASDGNVSGTAVGRRRRWAASLRGAAIAAALATGLSGCASVDGSNGFRDTEVSENDPLEGLNRQIFAANLAVDTFLLKPAAVGYREIVPDFGKDIIRNFLNNLRSPLILINDLAQGEGERAQTTLSRLMVNTFLGIGGLFDPASSMGLAYHSEDVGQTLATYGVDDGPYLVLPILGPSNARDAVGTAIGWLIDPVRIAVEAADAEEALYARAAAEGVDLRYRLMPTFDELRRTSLDFYAFTRSAYRQRRVQDIRNLGGGSVAKAEAPETAVAAAPVDPAPVDVPPELSTASPQAVQLAEAPKVPAVDPLYIEPRAVTAYPDRRGASAGAETVPAAARQPVDPAFIEPRQTSAEVDPAAADATVEAAPTRPMVDPLYIEPRDGAFSVADALPVADDSRVTVAATAPEQNIQIAAIERTPVVEAPGALGPVASDPVSSSGGLSAGAELGAQATVADAGDTPSLSTGAPMAATGLAEEALRMHEAALKSYEAAVRSADALARNEQVQK